MPLEPPPPREPDHPPPVEHGPVVVLGLGFGSYPRVTSLNPRFLPGHGRLKVCVRIDPSAVWPARVRALARRLQGVAPGLGGHTCGDGTSPIHLPAAAGGHTAPEIEPGVEVAHLLEHTIIELQHAVAGLTRCSGVTCAHREPPDRFDLFVESPSPGVGRLCAALSLELVNDLLGETGSGAAARLRQVVAVARLVEAARHGLVTRASALPAVNGDVHAADVALRELDRLGFLLRATVGVNFSGLPAYERPPASVEAIDET